MNLKKLSFKNVVRIINFYPPYLGAGVKAKVVDEKKLTVSVKMNLTALNKNYVGTHFGGSLYSMVDPFYMLILMRKLGRDYIVWDKSASIDFKKPGDGLVEAYFEITDSQVEEIKKAVEDKGKHEPVFEVLVKNKNGGIVASVSKKLWVKKKV